MKAIIVAGGRGERLRPITDNIPKPMVEILGKPILLHVIEQFKKNGIKDFIIALCFMPDVITKYFGDGKKFGVKITYTFENPQEPLGTAGAITLAKELINGTFVVTYADILRVLDLKRMINFHKSNKSFATLNIYRRRKEEAKSIIKINKSKQITEFVERPRKMQQNQRYIWSNGACYIFEPEIFNFIPKGQVDFGSNVFPKLLKEKKKIFGFTTRDYFVDIGNIEKLEFARQTFRK